MVINQLICDFPAYIQKFHIALKPDISWGKMFLSHLSLLNTWESFIFMRVFGVGKMVPSPILRGVKFFPIYL